MFRIRRETANDIAGVRRVNEAAFGQATEADLVDALREAASPFISLVAEHEEEIVGHICFTPVRVERTAGPPETILGLAPMAVLPERQREGIGSKLVEAGLDECRRAGFDAVVVLGHPDYYPRFGFEPAAPKGLVSEYDVPEPVFMILELRDRDDRDLSGVARYHDVFRNFA
jgi:putative acetyltransferase